MAPPCRATGQPPTKVPLTMTSPAIEVRRPTGSPFTARRAEQRRAASPPLSLPSTATSVVTAAPTAVAMLETLVTTVAAVAMFDGAALLAAGALIVVRALRTPHVRLVTRPLDGVDRAATDLVGVFGVAALVFGGTVADSAARWVVLAVIVLASRVVANVVTRAVRARRRRSRVVVSGPSAEVAPLLALLRECPQLGIDAEAIGTKTPRWRDEAGYADAVVLLDSSRSLKELGPLVRRWRGPALFLGTQMPGGATTETLWTHRLQAVPPRPVDRPAWVVRSAVERMLAVLGLVALTPLLAAVAMAVRLSGPGPILFRQERVGLDGNPFTIMKFRSMPVEHRDSGWNAAEGSQPTKVGRFLRDTSLDELPQLLNIARGDMSLIGPRPEMPHYVAQFEAEFDGYAERHRVPVGLTGWAQAHGLRGDTSLADRVRFDNNYIDDWSARRDVLVLFRTLGQLVPSRWRRRPIEVDEVIDLRTELAEAASAPSTLS